MDNNLELKKLIEARNELSFREQQLYIGTIEKINISMKELLKNDFGTELIKNSSRDLVGEMSRRFFDFGDYYLTVDQLHDRFINFSYEKDYDPLKEDSGIRKALYNSTDNEESASLKRIISTCKNSQKQLFDTNRAQDRLDAKGKKAYRDFKINNNGKLFDELTGQEGSFNTIIKNGKEVKVSDLHADHIQAREAIKYNKRYIRESKIEELKEFYNSSNNMQMMHASANTSKGDIRVCEDQNGNIVFLTSKELKTRNSNSISSVTDITSSKATPEQLADATIFQWEKDTKSGNKKEILKLKGYLDENGKIKPSVRKELTQNIKQSQNKESITILKSANYKNISKDSLIETGASMKKILAGQILYYVAPPIFFETRKIVKNKMMTLEKFFVELKKSGKRVIKYVVNNLKEIFKNISGNAISKFIKIFFDIIIEMVKASVKRLTKVIKDVVLGLINSANTLADKSKTAGEKADAITNILATSINAVILELFFEYIEKQFSLPNFLTEPLQIIVTVLSTNIIMLLLKKLDLFNVQYGFLVSNIEQLFKSQTEQYISASNELFLGSKYEYEEGIKMIKEQINVLNFSISTLKVYEDDVQGYLEQISDTFAMEIDFNKDWEEYLGFI